MLSLFAAHTRGLQSKLPLANTADANTCKAGHHGLQSTQASRVFSKQRPRLDQPLRIGSAQKSPPVLPSSQCHGEVTGAVGHLAMRTGAGSEGRMGAGGGACCSAWRLLPAPDFFKGEFATSPESGPWFKQGRVWACLPVRTGRRPSAAAGQNRALRRHDESLAICRLKVPYMLSEAGCRHSTSDSWPRPAGQQLAVCRRAAPLCQRGCLLGFLLGCPHVVCFLLS